MRSGCFAAAWLIAGLACGGTGALAQEASQSASPSPAGWDSFVDDLRTLPSRMLAKLPEGQRKDPQIQQEVARLALEALASSTLEVIGGDGDHPEFLPIIGRVMNVAQPNADTIYRRARITPGGTYRLRGRRGSVHLARIGEFAAKFGGAGGGGSGNAKAYHDLNALHIDSEGRFDVILSPERPPEWTGDWWRSDRTTNALLLRLVSSDWSTERDPTISIERFDLPVTRSRRPAADLEQRLRLLPDTTSSLALLFVGHVEELRREGYINRLRELKLVGLAALAGQFYYEGAYDLADGEALIVEAKVPASCGYRSLILTNNIYETIDWYDNQSSLNDVQAKPDQDGVLRIIVSAKDPGVPNWLDTAGHSKGLIQGRWTDCSSQPIPSVRKVVLADVRKFLPPATPVITQAERERLIRDRRSAYQQRPIW